LPRLSRDCGYAFCHAPSRKLDETMRMI